MENLTTPLQKAKSVYPEISIILTKQALDRGQNVQWMNAVLTLHRGFCFTFLGFFEVKSIEIYYHPQFVIINVSSVGSRMAVLTIENSIHPNKYFDEASARQRTKCTMNECCFDTAQRLRLTYLLGWILFSVVNTAILLPTDETIIMTNWGGNAFHLKKILWK